jgi:hypothetical protein
VLPALPGLPAEPVAPTPTTLILVTPAGTVNVPDALNVWVPPATSERPNLPALAIPIGILFFLKNIIQNKTSL